MALCVCPLHPSSPSPSHEPYSLHLSVLPPSLLISVLLSCADLFCTDASGTGRSDSRLVAEGAWAVGPQGHSPCSGGLAFQCLWCWDIEGLGEADRSPSLGGAGQGVGACVQPSGAVRLGTRMASVSASSASTQQRSRTVSWMDPGPKILPLSQT